VFFALALAITHPNGKNPSGAKIRGNNVYPEIPENTREYPKIPENT